MLMQYLSGALRQRLLSSRAAGPRLDLIQRIFGHLDDAFGVVRALTPPWAPELPRFPNAEGALHEAIQVYETRWRELCLRPVTARDPWADARRNLAAQLDDDVSALLSYLEHIDRDEAMVQLCLALADVLGSFSQVFEDCDYPGRYVAAWSTRHVVVDQKTRAAVGKPERRTLRLANERQTKGPCTGRFDPEHLRVSFYLDDAVRLLAPPYTPSTLFALLYPDGRNPTP